jgi:nucleotide sugar dehydrogenase
MNEKTVCVVGLGYVGLPLAVRSKERGYRVFGFDTNEEKIALINNGKSPIMEEFLDERIGKWHPEASSDPKIIKEADIVLICVPTPVDEMHNPDYEPVIQATELVASNLKKGALVILESTVNPGVSEEIVAPIFESKGYVIGTDVHLAHCPERINPGDKKWNVTNIPRVIGALSETGLNLGLEFYRSIVDGEIRPMKTIKAAEAVKILENSFRNINIAFVNELARSFAKLDIDVKDVIEGAATKPFAFMAHYPSCGIGGHCIPVDPYYLVEYAKKTSGFEHKFLSLALEINREMPAYTVEILQDALNDVKLPMNGTRVGILGLAYKANIDDLRESPSFEIIKHLKKHSCIIETFDPYIESQSTKKSLEELLANSDAIVLATNHKSFIESVTPDLLEKYGVKVLIDGKNCLDHEAFKKSSIVYKGIGR